MALSEFSLKNRYTVYALSIAAVVFGIIAYFTLPIQLFPDTAPPLVNILTGYPGAVAEDVADLVSDPIEREVSSLDGVVRVASKSQNGLSLVEVEFRYGYSVDLVAVDVQNALSRIRNRLPRDIGEPQVMKFSTSNRPVLTLGLHGNNLTEIRQIAEDYIAPIIQRVPGVAFVDVFGGHQPEISIEVNRNKLDSYQLPLSAVTEAIRAYNVSVPAGQINSEGQQYTFRINEESETVSDLAEIPIALPGGGRIKVKDVAEVAEGAGEDLSRFRVNGVTAIALQVFKQDEANTVEVVNLVEEKFSELSEIYPEITVTTADESATFTQQVVSNMLGAIAQALFLASIIIFLFLGSLRRGLVVAISMPLSFLLTFAGMKLLSIELNLVTLTAVILAVGMVVDASVVVLENITRRFAEGNLTAFNAALEGAKEIQFSVIAGNATTITVLVPLLFLYGFVGKTFGPLVSTMIIAFLSSLLVALSIVPILTMMVTKEGGKLEQIALTVSKPWHRLMDWVRGLYIALLTKAIEKKLLVFSIAILMFVVGMFILRSRGMELLPKMDGGDSFITVETPSGSSLDETEWVVKQIEDIIMSEADVVRVSSQIGFEPGMKSLTGGVQGPTQGYITMTLTPRTKRSETIWEIQDRIRENLSKVPNIQNYVVRESGSTAKATTKSSIVVSLRGEDPLVLDKLGDQLVDVVGNVNGTVNTYRSWRIDQKSFILSVNRERAVELGISPALAAQVLTGSLDGVPAGMLRKRTTSVPIRVRYDVQFRGEESDATSVRFLSPTDRKSIPINSILDTEEIYAQGLVTRENLEFTLDILALHQDRPLNFVTRDVANSVQSVNLPQGYTITMAGEEQDMAESRKELVNALLISLIAVYLLLVAQFKSFLHPLTVLMAVPLSLIGISLALWIAGKPVSMPVLVGLILLVGIVVNNSIILIDFIRQKRNDGVGRKEAIIASVETRFRPIMMTSLSTIFGMIPLAMEWSLGAERFSPLAIAVIGGMTASTLLTMIVIPVLYDTFDKS